MSEHVISAERLSPGVIDHYAAPDAPDVVQDLCDSLGFLMLDHPDVERLEITVQVTR